ncbi:MAG: geranylgeranyl diphosphate synthase type II [Parvicellaceae bacterium]|jgi:geranylgeranyl diphosphate synthase type II
MRSIREYQQIITDSIEDFKSSNKSLSLYDPVNYILSMGGKRMRPAILLMANDLFDGELEDAINPALAVEVFHNFTLLHDDIMDHAPIRRGKPTVHEKWGVNEAILSGDVMMVQAVQLMTMCPDRVLRNVLDVFSVAAVEVCEGQQMDMDFELRDDVSIAEYLTMIELKTSVLLAGAMKIGALIGGASKDDANQIYEFGRNLGVSFQIMDDILDVYGDQEKFGKQVGGDIIENKKTYLLLKALELAGDETRSVLDDAAKFTEDRFQEKVKVVTEAYDSLDVRTKTEVVMNQFYAKAIQNLDAISLPEERKVPLYELAKGLLQRES